MPAGPVPPQRILIVGGGEFGLTLAEELLRTTYAHAPGLVTILDRSATPPALDAASSDYNKIVRSDYADAMHSTLAKRAIAEWQKAPYDKDYFQCGTLILSSTTHSAAQYVNASLALNQQGAIPLHTPCEVQNCFPSTVPRKGEFTHQTAYLNQNCGYATARSAMDSLCDRVRTAGARFLQGRATRIIYDTPTSPTDSDQDISKRKVVGIELASGETLLDFDFFVVAAGAWTGQLVPELDRDLVASGQIVGTIQLTEEEATAYKGCPVVFAMDTGFYVFPPNEQHICKFAIHGAGYLFPTANSASTPRTILSEGGEHDNIPREALLELKAGLARVYPSLAEKRWAGSRLCWYNDSPSSNWLLDFLSPNLFVLGADSGHAFKFLPLMGSLAADSLYSRLPAEQAKAWSFAELKRNQKGDASRGGTGMSERKLLRTADMASSDEL